MILDPKGNKVNFSTSCPECGADEKEKRPVLGGRMVCSKCGYMSEENQNEKTKSDSGRVIS